MMENEIRKIIAQRVESIKNGDLEACIAFFADDIISFDVLDPLQNFGKNAVKNRLSTWLSTMAKIKNFEITKVTIQANETLAFCSSLNHIDAVSTEGTQNDMWWRETTCYKNTDGVWKITHIHASTPFNPETGIASIDLKP